jgi:crotonobetainyl-CoA:carnitine CoA-transferase CaiB-like acyl-CoA transferase
MTDRRPLEGIRVLDLSQWLPGPYCTSLLADLGAAVTKVESPAGDIARTDVPGLFASVNRSKRSLVLDLKQKAGTDAFLHLAEHADVVVESFRPGTADRLGIGPVQVRLRNPAVIYCSISGYGQDGPYRDWFGHDVNYLGVAGAPYLDAPVEGLPPVTGVLIADLSSGMYAALAILATLRRRDETGEGDYLDVAMTDGLLAWTIPMLSTVAPGGPPLRLGDFGAYGYFEAADGRLLALGVYEDRQWVRLCSVVGRRDLERDTRLATPEGRRAHAAYLRRELADALATRGRDDWVIALTSAGVAASPVNRPDEVLADPQVAHRGGVRQVNGHLEAPMPVRFGGFSVASSRPAPALGEDGKEVLLEVGFSVSEVAELAQAGILGGSLHVEEPAK